MNQHFGFKRGATDAIRASNVALYKLLKTHAAFHYKVCKHYCILSILTWTSLYQDPREMSGFCQGKIISEVLHAVWFNGKHSQGIIFENLFNPIPLETIAIILTLV